MKKLLLSVLLALGCIAVYANPANSGLFSMDEEQINARFDRLNNLENYVNAHEGVTLDQLQSENNPAVSDLNLTDGTTGIISAISGEPPLGIPSFLWGCILGWIGILVVYLVTDGDKTESKKALWGCIASTVGYVVFYIIYVVLIVASSTTTY
ncbi:MAG: hypothetical protein HYY40_11625 [Bacteroidetes bacterium]|nr:hypothetical protein [Bacteroidota bacterium]